MLPWNFDLESLFTSAQILMILICDNLQMFYDELYVKYPILGIGLHYKTPSSSFESRSSAKPRSRFMRGRDPRTSTSSALSLHICTVMAVKEKTTVVRVCPSSWLKVSKGELTVVMLFSFRHRKVGKEGKTELKYWQDKR